MRFSFGVTSSITFGMTPAAMLLQKYLSLQRPISMERTWLISRRRIASNGRCGMPRARDISLTVPTGIKPKVALKPPWAIPFTVSLTVPSPPMQKTASKPSSQAAFAKRVASSAPVVNLTSIVSKRVLNFHCKSRAYRRAAPPPDTGLMITKQRLIGVTSSLFNCDYLEIDSHMYGTYNYRVYNYYIYMCSYIKMLTFYYTHFRRSLKV